MEPRLIVKATQREIVYPFERVSNFRDVGGLTTVDGRTLKTGVLFRSEELSRMTARDLATLRDFKLKLICDLRSPRERREKPSPAVLTDTIRVVNIPILPPANQDGTRKLLFSFLFGKTGGARFREFSRACYHSIAFEQTSRIRDVITLLSKEESLPALIHCSAGKDRTGFLAALIQLLAGVPYEMVMDDYLLTNDHFRPRLERFIQWMRILTLWQVSPERIRLVAMAHREFLDEVHTLIVRDYGSVEMYLSEACQIEHDTLRNLKNRLFS
ncbi:MAG: tyrosine-protein phosphatase [Bryobacterales bacterium]|nr:tyrosine-protein phosphatase [Bryobacterales bacterium]